MAKGEAPTGQVEDCFGLLLGVYITELLPQEVYVPRVLVHGGRLRDIQYLPLGVHFVSDHPQPVVVQGPKGEARQLQGVARGKREESHIHFVWVSLYFHGEYPNVTFLF